MIKVPSDIMSRFQTSLDRRPIPKRYQAYYKKWLRFYWDFCHKYHHPAAKCESLRPFIEKLRQKKQKNFQIRQASDAVSLYLIPWRGIKKIDGILKQVEFPEFDSNNFTGKFIRDKKRQELSEKAEQLKMKIRKA